MLRDTTNLWCTVSSSKVFPGKSFPWYKKRMTFAGTKWTGLSVGSRKAPTHGACAMTGWRRTGCVARTERMQLQRLLGDPVRMLARTRTETRGNPDRGARVPATKPSFCHAVAARRLHAVARDRDVPRPSSPRQLCARSCRVRAYRLHRCPEGLLHPAVHLAFGCEMPKMTSDDGAAQPPTPGWERAARRLAAKARSRPTFPAIALSSSCTMA